MKHRLIYSLLFVAILAAGCSKEPLPQEPPLPEAGQQEVKFNLSIREGGKVIPLSQSRSVAGTLANGFRMMGFLTDQPAENTTSCTYLFGQDNKNAFWTDINPDGTSADGVKRYWKKDGATYHTFWAYTTNNGSSMYQYGLDNNGATRIWNVKRSFDINPADQGDLLMATTPNIQVADGTPAPTVNLEFYHATARMMFRVYGSGGAPVDNIQASITYAKNVRSGERGRLMLHKPAIGMSSTTGGESYPLAAPFVLPGTANTFSSAVEVGDLMLLAQTTNADWLTFTLTYIPPGKTNPVETSIKMPAMTLELEKQYNVTLNLIAESQTLTLSQVTLTDWGTPVTGTVDPW